MCSVPDILCLVNMLSRCSAKIKQKLRIQRASAKKRLTKGVTAHRSFENGGLLLGRFLGPQIWVIDLEFENGIVPQSPASAGLYRRLRQGSTRNVLGRAGALQRNSLLFAKCCGITIRALF